MEKESIEVIEVINYYGPVIWLIIWQILQNFIFIKFLFPIALNHKFYFIKYDRFIVVFDSLEAR